MTTRGTLSGPDGEVISSVTCGDWSQLLLEAGGFGCSMALVDANAGWDPEDPEGFRKHRDRRPGDAGGLPAGGEGNAVQFVLSPCLVEPARGEGLRDRIARSKEVMEDSNSIGEVYHIIIVRVGSLHTSEGWTASEQVTQDEDAVADLDQAARIGVPALEGAPH